MLTVALWRRGFCKILVQDQASAPSLASHEGCNDRRAVKRGPQLTARIRLLITAWLVVVVGHVQL